MLIDMWRQHAGPVSPNEGIPIGLGTPEVLEISAGVS